MARKFKITIEVEDEEAEDQTTDDLKSVYEKDVFPSGFGDYGIEFKIITFEEIQPQS